MLCSLSSAILDGHVLIYQVPIFVINTLVLFLEHFKTQLQTLMGFLYGFGCAALIDDAADSHLLRIEDLGDLTECSLELLLNIRLVMRVCVNIIIHSSTVFLYKKPNQYQAIDSFPSKCTGSDKLQASDLFRKLKTCLNHHYVSKMVNFYNLQCYPIR